LRKKIITTVLLVTIISMLAAPVFADGSGMGSLYDRIKKPSIAEEIIPQGGGSNETQILELIDEKVSSIVATVRVLATIFAVIFLIWMGLIFFTAGNNPQKLMGAKTQMAFFFISMLLIFLAEPIVRFVMSWFLPEITGS